MGLMASMILGAESPINIWEDRIVFVISCAEDSAFFF